MFNKIFLRNTWFLVYSRFFLSSSDEHDKTVLSWVVGRSHGAGLQVSGDSITVVTKGLYFIYSQVSAVYSVYHSIFNDLKELIPRSCAAGTL